MIKGRLIVCIASSWDYDPTSKHQIMKILSTHNDILWINYHGSRRPRISSADLWDGCAALRRVARGLHRATSSIVQLTPLVIPGATNPLLWRLHQRLLIAQLRRGVRTMTNGQERPIQVWTFAPDVPYLVGALDEECFVYYCVDEYTQFDGFESKHITAAENELIDRADVVITTSGPLMDTKRARRPDAVLVRHGVDYDHFARSWRSLLPRPADLATIPRPIFGFFGLIHHWVDRALLADVARQRPLYSFVVIGDCKADVSELEALDNVFLLGRRPYEDLPTYCAAFDAGMLLFTRNAMTRSVNPVKMYEYLAAGLPVISTPLPEAKRYEGPIIMADTARSFAQACDRVLDGHNGYDRKTISGFVESETWASKVEYLSDVITARTNPPLRAMSKPRDEVLPPDRTVPEMVPSIR